MSIEPESYWSTARAQLESERLWPRVWLAVAHVSQLPVRGAFASLSIGRDPIVVVNDGERISAFHDVCRHRGARITREDAGRCAELRCSYHGWTYGLDGALRAAPHADGAQVHDRPGLERVACEARYGLVWVTLDPDRAGPLDAWLSPLAAYLERAPWLESVLAHAVRVEVPCNWKASADVNNEGYHLRALHPELAGIVELARIDVEVRGAHTHFRIPLHIDGVEAIKHQLCIFPNLQINWLEGSGDAELYRHWPHASDPERAHFEELRLAPTRGESTVPRTKNVPYGQSLGPILDADLAMLPFLQQGLRSSRARAPRAHRLELPIVRMHEHIDALLSRP